MKVFIKEHKITTIVIILTTVFLAMMLSCSRACYFPKPKDIAPLEDASEVKDGERYCVKNPYVFSEVFYREEYNRDSAGNPSSITNCFLPITINVGGETLWACKRLTAEAVSNITRDNEYSFNNRHSDTAILQADLSNEEVLAAFDEWCNSSGIPKDLRMRAVFY